LQTEDPVATVARLLEAREPVYQGADLTILSRDVPHERIVDECMDAVLVRLSGHAAPSAQESTATTDGMSAAP
jgi:shikimate kinase